MRYTAKNSWATSEIKRTSSCPINDTKSWTQVRLNSKQNETWIFASTRFDRIIGSKVHEFQSNEELRISAAQPHKILPEQCSCQTLFCFMEWLYRQSGKRLTAANNVIYYKHHKREGNAGTVGWLRTFAFQSIVSI